MEENKNQQDKNIDESFLEESQVSLEQTDFTPEPQAQSENTIRTQPEPIKSETIRPEDKITVRPVKFQDFDNNPPICTIKKNLDILQDIDLHISVELGRAKSSIKEVMAFEKGSVIELNKVAGEQVEIFVNDKLVAKGEVIVIEDKFGVRITNTNIVKSII